MKLGIIGDSSCDLTSELKRSLEVEIVPLKLTVEGLPTFVDNDQIDLPALWAAMRASKTATTTACPSPEEYMAAMEKYDQCVVIPLSARLSGSYNSAQAGRELLLEAHPEKKVHVFNSESASAGETRITMLVRQLERQGLGFDEIIAQTTAFIEKMRTLFVLDDLTNLVKNGRLGKVAGMAATVMGIRPILSDDGHGEIVMRDKVRGSSHALERMVEIVAEETAGFSAGSTPLVLAHCNCPQRAAEVAKMLRSNCPALADIVVVGTRGLSSVYASEGGVILAF